MKKFLILAILLFVGFTSTARGASTYRGVWYAGAGYPYWSEWGYWAYQYSDGFQPYSGLPDTRKNVLQGKILNNDEPGKGSKKAGKKVFAGKVF